jgi:hypothetical protein
MPKVSKESAAHVAEQGPGKEWREDLEGYTVSFVAVSQDADLTPLLKGLPNDECPSPHWGYVLKGSIWFRSGDGDEVFEAGDAFYAPPGHVSGASADSEFVIFSPSELMAEVEAHMARNAQSMQSA